MKMNIKSLITLHILNSNYYLARITYYSWLSIKLSIKQPILVYSMGKVGSSTLLISLESANLGLPVYQTDALTDRELAKDEAFFYGNTRRYLRKAKLPETRYLFISYYLLHRIKSNSLGEKDNKLKVITMTREPIARNISDFFEQIEYWVPNFSERLQANSISIDELTHIFLDKYNNHIETLTWFESEFKEALKVDLYQHEFPTSKGYMICEDESIQVLVMRLEDLRKCHEYAFEEFLGRKVPLVNANEAVNKEYNALYRKFLSSVVLPSNYVEKMYTSQYVRHFYSPEEISAFRAKWHVIP